MRQGFNFAAIGGDQTTLVRSFAPMLEAVRGAMQRLDHTPPVGWVGSIQSTVSGFSTGVMSRLTATASPSLRQSTHSSGSVGAGVDLLVRHVGRHVDEVARAGLGGELQLLAPAHARPAPHDVDHALEVAVVVGAGLGVGVDGHRAGPELLRADAGEVDRRLAIHAGCLGRVGVELAGRDDAHAVVLPRW